MHFRPLFSCFSIASIAAISAFSANAATLSADTIYYGGEIVTVNELQPEAEAVAVKDGKILSVGYKDEIMHLKGNETKLVDLAGKAMLPGFFDPHSHVFMTGVQAVAANLLPKPDGEVNSVADLQAVLKTWVEQNQKITGKYKWIIGFGYDDAQLKEQRHPTRDELDAVSTDLPIVIIHQSGHLGTMNSKALELCGITAESSNPKGGTIRRREGSQEPNGVLEEAAFFGPFFTLMSKLDSEANKALFLAGVNLYKSYGYTTAQEGRASVSSVNTMAAVADSGKLDIDVVAYPDIATSVEVIKEPLLSHNYTNHFRVGGAKITLDGSPQGKRRG